MDSKDEEDEVKAKKGREGNIALACVSIAILFVDGESWKGIDEHRKHVSNILFWLGSQLVQAGLSPKCRMNGYNRYTTSIKPQVTCFNLKLVATKLTLESSINTLAH